MYKPASAHPAAFKFLFSAHGIFAVVLLSVAVQFNGIHPGINTYSVQVFFLPVWILPLFQNYFYIIDFINF